MSILSNRNKRTLSIESSALPNYLDKPMLEVIRLKGVEGLNELFEYQIELKAGAEVPSYLVAELDLSKLSGQEATLKIELDGKGGFIAGSIGNAVGSVGGGVGGGMREISGIISEVSYLRQEGKQHVYGLSLRPWLWLASLHQDCKIYQDQSVIEVMDTLFANYAFPIEKRLTDRHYPKRDYQVQFNETDYDFFARLSEEWGIAWWFEHVGGKHRLILSDIPGGFSKSSAAYESLNFYPPNYKLDEEYIDFFSVKDKVVSGSWTSADVDYTQSRLDLSRGQTDARNTAHADYDVFEWANNSAQPKAGAGGYSGSNAGERNKALEEGARRARIRMDAIKGQGFRANGAGNLRGIEAGKTFKLNKHPQTKANIEWVVLSTELEIEEIAETSQGSAMDTLVNGIKQAVAGQRWQCRVKFESQPSAVFYSPEVKRQKPEVSLLTAVVSGPSNQDTNQEIWTDALGRVKVKFPWDRYNKSDERSSCWLRVSSPWSGSEYGMIHTPRIGQEVLVEFENGDVDRPIITGRVYNDQNMPPWALANNQALSGIRSKQLHGSGNNQLILDDSESGVQAKLTSSHQASELSLGSITRIEKNEGVQDKRGEGFELRTDAQGVVRANGLLITTESRNKAQSYVKAMDETTSRLAQAQKQHAQTAEVAKKNDAHEGGESDEAAEAIKQQNETIQGKTKADVKAGTFPELEKPHLILSSPAGIETTTAGSTHIASDKHTMITSGEQVSISAGKGFLISALGNMKAFVQGCVSVVSYGPVMFKSLKNTIKVLAAMDVEIQSETVIVKAKKKLLISGGDSGMVFEDGSANLYSSGGFKARVETKNGDISTENAEPMSAVYEQLSATSAGFNRGLSAYDQQILVSKNDSQQAKPIKKDVLADISHFEY